MSGRRELETPGFGGPGSALSSGERVPSPQKGRTACQQTMFRWRPVTKRHVRSAVNRHQGGTPPRVRFNLSILHAKFRSLWGADWRRSGPQCGANFCCLIHDMSMIRLGILPWCCVTLQLWQYPEVSGAYAIKLTPTASQDAVSGAQEMLIRTTFSALPAATPSAPVVAAVGLVGPGSLTSVVPDALARLGRLRPVEFRYCMLASAAAQGGIALLGPHHRLPAGRGHGSGAPEPGRQPGRHAYGGPAGVRARGAAQAREVAGCAGGHGGISGGRKGRRRPGIALAALGGRQTSHRRHSYSAATRA